MRKIPLFILERPRLAPFILSGQIKLVKRGWYLLPTTCSTVSDIRHPYRQLKRRIITEYQVYWLFVVVELRLSEKVF